MLVILKNERGGIFKNHNFIKFFQNCCDMNLINVVQIILKDTWFLNFNQNAEGLKIDIKAF